MKNYTILQNTVVWDDYILTDAPRAKWDEMSKFYNAEVYSLDIPPSFIFNNIFSFKVSNLGSKNVPWFVRLKDYVARLELSDIQVVREEEESKISALCQKLQFELVGNRDETAI